MKKPLRLCMEILWIASAALVVGILFAVMYETVTGAAIHHNANAAAFAMVAASALFVSLARPDRSSAYSVVLQAIAAIAAVFSAREWLDTAASGAPPVYEAVWKLVLVIGVISVLGLLFRVRTLNSSE